MTEIELKAHVYDRKKTVENLNSFAKYEDSVIRDDIYYKNESNGKPSIRIRNENRDSGKDCLITYKRKEIRTGDDGVKIEVNNEMETFIGDPEPLKAFLEDAGYTVSLKKHKEVQDWSFITEDGKKATLELCSVPPLGDFLEIEILSPVNDEKTVSETHKTLKMLLSRAGIPEKDIEERYYSEMLREISNNL